MVTVMATLVGVPGAAAGAVTSLVPGLDNPEQPEALHEVTYTYSVPPTLAEAEPETVVEGAVTTASGAPLGTAVRGTVLE